MSEGKKKKSGFFKRLSNKYRLVVMNDETFEERLSFRLSRLNVFIAVGASVIILIIITTYIIAFTPLREYIPVMVTNRIEIFANLCSGQIR